MSGENSLGDPAAPRSHAPRIGIVYFEGGTAHRSSALALRAALLSRHPNWEVRALDALDLFRVHRPLHATLRLGLAWFNHALRTESVRALRWMIALGRAYQRFTTPRAVPRLAEWWQERPPDMVVSTIPLYNEVLALALRRARPGAGYVVLPVDFEEPTARYWFDPRVDARYLVPTEPLARQAREAGVPSERIERLSGFVVHPRFYEPDPRPRFVRLAELGLPADRPLVLVCFGGQGSDLMPEIGEGLAALARPLSALFVCGRNARARRRLEAATVAYPKAVVGFTESMHRFLPLASCFIGKAGPLSIHEAIVSGTPMVLFRSRGMEPLLGPNERWVASTGCGLLVERPEELPRAVCRALDDASWVAKLGARRHRGVHETVEILERWLARFPS